MYIVRQKNNSTMICFFVDESTVIFLKCFVNLHSGFFLLIVPLLLDKFYFFLHFLLFVKDFVKNLARF